MENFKIETQDFIQNILNLKKCILLTDAHKEKTIIWLKFKSICESNSCTTIENENEYNDLVKYIRTNISSTMFTVKFESFDYRKPCLCLYT